VNLSALSPSGGWFQSLPEDAGVCVRPESGQSFLRAAVTLGDDAATARTLADEALSRPVDPVWLDISAVCMRREV